MTRLERLTNYLEKAKTKPTNSPSQEVDQQILIMRLMTEVKREKKHVTKRV